MRVRQQTGETKLANLFWFALIALGLNAGWNVGPIYYAKYQLEDKVTDICRLPRNNTDERLREILWKDVVTLEMADAIGNRTAFKITTEDYKRRIVVEWDQELKWLPGYKRVHHFVIETSAPML